MFREEGAVAASHGTQRVPCPSWAGAAGAMLPANTGRAAQQAGSSEKH